MVRFKDAIVSAVGLLACCLLGNAGVASAQAEQQAAPSTNAASATPPPPPPACAAPENRQFDFWIGHWRVINTGDRQPAGESRIERLYDGCTIRENWVEPTLTGGSLNTYVDHDRQWHQTWTDSGGTWREFVGGIVDGKMVLVWTHPSFRVPGHIVRERVSLTPNADGSVRQYSDRSVDGAAWTEIYDYTYLRVAD